MAVLAQVVTEAERRVKQRAAAPSLMKADAVRVENERVENERVASSRG